MVSLDNLTWDKPTILVTRIDGVLNYAVRYSWKEFALCVTEVTQDKSKAVPFILKSGMAQKVPMAYWMEQDLI